MPLSAAMKQVDVERARAFVLAAGSALDAARLAAIMGGSAPAREASRSLETLQNADGGFPTPGATAGGASSPGVTCRYLAIMREMPPLGGSPMASRAVAYLRRVQRVDGAWSEEPAAAAGGLDLTALCTYTLLVLDAGHLDPVARGDLWLRRTIGGIDGPISLMALGYASAVWYRLHGAGAQEVALTYHRVTRSEPGPDELSSWLAAALEVGVGGRFVVPLVRMIERLTALQNPDGAWGAGDGAVQTTLQSLRVFRGYGLL